MKKFKQILVIVGLGSIASLAQADCSSHQSQGTCLPPSCMWSIDANGGKGGCVGNTGTPEEATNSKEAITSDAKTNKHNKKGLKDVKRS